MSTLAVIMYPEGAAAGEAAAVLKQMQSTHSIQLKDIAWVTKDTDGTLKLHHGTSLDEATADDGALRVFLSTEDDWIDEVASAIPESGSALFVMTRNAHAKRVVPEMEKLGGLLFKTILSSPQELEVAKALT
jgi:uncharacterized membrane protein